MPSVQESIAVAQKELEHAGIDNPSLDARVLAAYAFGWDRAKLLSCRDDPVPPDALARFHECLRRRLDREPVARILGQREFWGLPFSLNADTLEPRPDSETLVEVVLRHADKAAPHRILDLGTGSGCLLLAVLHDLPAATGLGVDLAAGAVEQARRNASFLGLEDRARFQVGRWFEGLVGTYDIILSNPPYIPSRDISGLQPEVFRYDPARALDGGTDGLDAYRAIVSQAWDFLSDGGLLALEVGLGQAGDVGALIREQDSAAPLGVQTDLAGVERVVYARKTRVSG